jgi:hypothetical protein
VGEQIINIYLFKKIDPQSTTYRNNLMSKNFIKLFQTKRSKSDEKLLPIPKKKAGGYFLNNSRMERARDLRFSPFERE